MNKQENMNLHKTDGKSFTDYLTDTSTNVGKIERIASSVGGGALIAYGINRKDWLGTLLALVGGGVALRGVTGHCQVYDALDVDTDKKSLLERFGKKSKSWHDQQTEVVKSVTINKSADELYNFWHNFENLPKFMNHLESVEILDEKRSKWTAKAPLGSEVTWNAVITEDVKNEMISWTSYGDSQIENSGKVEFLPTVERGTEIKVTIRYTPPAGKLGELAAYFLTEEPETQVREDLRRFKKLMETGLIMTVEGQTSGRESDAPKAKTRTASA